MASEAGSSNLQSDVFSTHKVSDVWKCFTKMADKKKAIRSICKKALVYSGGTRNLCEHLSSQHSLQNFSAGGGKTTTGKKMITSLDGFVKSSKCTEACA